MTDRTSTSDSMEHQEIPRRSGKGPAPLSYGQELLWLMDRASPGLTAWNVPRVLRLRGALDRDALQRALGALVERHEILRSVFRGSEGAAYQEIQAWSGVPMSLDDLSSRPSAEREAEMLRLAAGYSAAAFDLSSDLMLRVALIKLADDDHVLCLGSHHIASDGWSRSVMFKELSAMYAAFRRGAEPALAPLPIQFADYATWERSPAHDQSLAESLAYWRKQLSGSIPELALPTDYRPAGTPGFRGALRVMTLPIDLVEKLTSLAQDNDVTFYMVMLATYATVLHRYTGQDDITVGSPIAGRTQSETEGLIGYFANTMVLRTDVSGNPTFRELLDRVRESSLDAYEHSEVPQEQIFLELRKDGENRLAPLFRVVLTMEETIPATLDFDGIAVESIESDEGNTKFDLTLLFSKQADGVRLRLAYRADLFSEGYAARFLEHFRGIVESAISAPDTRLAELQMLSAAERDQLKAWNSTSVDLGPPATITQLFEAQAARVPNRVAVVGPRPSATASGSVAGTLPLSYAEVNVRANQLARHLLAMGLVSNTPVGLLLDRSVDAVIGLLGILKAGGAYVPLSVDAPSARIAQQLTECGAKLVVTAQQLADRLPASVSAVSLDSDATSVALTALPDTNVEPSPAPADLAYVLYTSGSTGTPKGVAVTHANVVNYARGVSRAMGEVPADRAGDGFAALDGMRFGMVSTLAADLGNTSLFSALLAGGTLHVFAKDVTTDPSRFAEYAAVHELDAIKITPNHLAALTAGKHGADLAAVLPRAWVITGGEALRPELARELLAAGKCRLLNHYGPTETTIGVCTFEATTASLEEVRALGAQTVPLGRPLANTRTYVVDRHGVELPVGVSGELWVGGEGVTRGYMHRDDLTAEKFVTFRGERVYRSGDTTRRLANGVIEFLGRGDSQVKVRGYRVELGEVEQVLRGHPGVAQAVVLLRTEDDGSQRLVAYAVAKSAGYAVSHGDRPTTEKLGEWLGAQLPDYMVPSAVVLIDALPLTANGKLDIRALPVPGAVAQDAQDSYVAPRTATEEIVARIWRDVLKKERVGITDSFLELGGHSLLAIRVLGRISKELGVRLALRTLFETPTVEKVAAIIDAERAPVEADLAMREALAAVEGLSDAEVAKLLGSDGT
ncbi:MAG: amino acid adenylation domain-containing protein [bacterium]